VSGGGGNDDMSGNANPVFCDVDTNFTTVHLNFSNFWEDIYMPCNVTCNCCYVYCPDDDDGTNE
jgi:hypothetical protein